MSKNIQVIIAGPLKTEFTIPTLTEWNGCADVDLHRILNSFSAKVNMLLDNAGADRVTRYKLMGHKGQDINENIYTHKDHG